MNLTEEQLRSALHDTAEEIPASRVPPLRLPAGARAGRPGRGARPGRWLPAVAAAIAVTAIAVVSVVLGGRNPQPASPGAGLPRQLPAYYVALQKLPGRGYLSPPDKAVIRSSATGRTLATIRVPAGYGTFARVLGGGNDRDFVLTAQQLEPWKNPPHPASRLYLLRIRPSGAGRVKATLTALSDQPLEGHQVAIAMALSPDGSRLAVLSTQEPDVHPMTLHVYDLRTGTGRAWAMSYSYFQGASMQWASDDRTLAVEKFGPDGTALLNTAAAGTSFGADSRRLRLPAPAATVVQTGLLMSDGRHIAIRLFYGTTRAGDPDAYGLDVLDAATSAVTPIRHRVQPFGLQWWNASGSAFVISDLNHPVSKTGKMVLYLWTARSTQRFLLPAQTMQVSW
jgi:hypothetical protein